MGVLQNKKNEDEDVAKRYVKVWSRHRTNKPDNRIKCGRNKGAMLKLLSISESLCKL